ncbi:unnamed protein product, partial [Heterobilharzia americana]
MNLASEYLQKIQEITVGPNLNGPIIVRKLIRLWFSYQYHTTMKLNIKHPISLGAFIEQ